MPKLLLTIILLSFYTIVQADKPYIIDSKTSTANIIQSLQKQPKMRDYRDSGGIAEDEPPKVAALIHFKIDSAVILKDSKPLLNKFGLALQSDELAHSVLMIAGHTDSTGSNIHNLSLSYRRAEAVKNYLMQHHELTEQRLIIRAYGEDQPIDSNKTKQGRKLNRRVEFIRID
ncbi:OmpA family protein [Candidatus Halobeggiatoa sp. HSG11]|nr:OmpA family protein [Candidatus Halobeggiatoa sp. HSG11]